MGQGNHASGQSCKRRITRANIRFGKAAAQVAFILIETDAAQALLRRGNEHGAEAALHHCPVDRDAIAAIFPSGWRHPHTMCGVGISAARRVITCIVKDRKSTRLKSSHSCAYRM